MDVSDYVTVSRLEVTVLRPGKARVSLAVTAEQWVELWHLERPLVERPIKPAEQLPTVFKLTFVACPGGRGAKPADLTVEAAIAAARAEIEAALADTAGPRKARDASMANRADQKDENKRNGRDRNRKD